MISSGHLNSLNQVGEIVFIGSGAAGLSATLAAEAGAKVILLEKRELPGGRSVRAEVFFTS